MGEAASERKQRESVDTAGWSVEQRREHKASVSIDDVRAAVELIRLRQSTESRSLDSLVGVEPMTGIRTEQASVPSAPAPEVLRERANEILYREMGELVRQKNAAEASGDRAALRKAAEAIAQAVDGATSGVLPPRLAQKIADELQVKIGEAQAIAKEIADARAKEVEVQQAIAKELAAQAKKTEWVCSQCHNSNASCPYAARNNGRGNIGGFTREIP